MVAEGSPTSIGPDNTLHKSVIWPACAHIWTPQSAPVRRNDPRSADATSSVAAPCVLSGMRRFRVTSLAGSRQVVAGVINTNMALACISEVRLLRE